MLLPSASEPAENNAMSDGHRVLFSLGWVDLGLPVIRLPPEESRLFYNLSSNLTQTKAVEVSKYIVNVAYMPR